ncbi:hypothetical protein AHF37_08321 [Paragonimus kellicotti]|nr:hypothetical protein AHF37_08321 [Paragonimus kellicotti]
MLDSFDRAVEFYLKGLRACPRRSDSWAALGLIYYSELEQIINLVSVLHVPWTGACSLVSVRPCGDPPMIRGGARIACDLAAHAWICAVGEYQWWFCG